MRISDWSSDVCSSDLPPVVVGPVNNGRRSRGPDEIDCSGRCLAKDWPNRRRRPLSTACNLVGNGCFSLPAPRSGWSSDVESFRRRQASESLRCPNRGGHEPSYGESCRSEEHTSELQSLMRISYAVFCLKKKNKNNITLQA